MKVNAIRIQNFRSIVDESYSFDKQFTVLIGYNGAGKTSILDALAFSLGTVFLGIGETNTISIKENDKRKSIVNPNSIEIKTPLRITLNHTFLNEEYKWSRESKNPNGASTTYKDANSLINNVKKVSEAVRNGTKINLPLIAYYGIGRLNDDVFERKKTKRSGSRFEGYKNALTPRTMQPKALEWMKEAESSSFQQFAKEEHETDKGLLRAFAQAIEILIPDWSEVRFHIKKDDVIGKTSHGTWQYLSMLSSGYKAIAKLAMDLAYRAVTLNPHLKENAVRDTSGVVLIDEIDMHLHPNWQRLVTKNLKAAFPNIQFIVTTHSPFVVQSLKAEEVIRLDGEIVSSPQNKSLEEVAQDEMGVDDVSRSMAFREYQDIAAKYFDLIEQGKDSINSEEVSHIKLKLDELELKFTNDPAYLALMKAERKSEMK